MDKSKILINSAVAGILAAGTTLMGTAYAVPEQPKEWERCAGVAMAGKNDCAALNGKHECAGQAATDNSKDEWVYVPGELAERSAAQSLRSNPRSKFRRH